LFGSFIPPSPLPLPLYPLINLSYITGAVGRFCGLFHDAVSITKVKIVYVCTTGKDLPGNESSISQALLKNVLHELRKTTIIFREDT
jgi:hypothetical protein